MKKRVSGNEQKTVSPAVTAYVGAWEKRHAFATGYQMYVSKPVEPGRLAATIASLAGRVKED
jgi:CheY-like chemotaxis protein